MKDLDPDKLAVYHAEAMVFQETLYDETLPDTVIENLASELFGSDWWQAQGIPVPKLGLRRLEAGNSHALTWHPTIKRDPEIRFSVFQVNAWTLAHEAAHIANDHLFNAFTDQTVTSHGKEFRSAYVTVSEILLGKRAAESLAESFNRYVRSSEPVRSEYMGEWEFSHEGIYPHWRRVRNIEEMRKLAKGMPTDDMRVNGAIAL